MDEEAGVSSGDEASSDELAGDDMYEADFIDDVQGSVRSTFYQYPLGYSTLDP